MGSRTWIKVYCDKWLEGTLREEEPAVRGVWIDLLTLAGGGKYGDSGEIKLTNGVGYSDRQMCEILTIKRSLWKRAKQRFLDTNRIEISPRGAISIVNWTKYQSEYERQKRYREPKPGYSTTEPHPPLTIPLKKEKEIEIESEKLHGEVTERSYNRELHRPGSSLEDDLPPPSACYSKRQGRVGVDGVLEYLREHGPCRLGQIRDGVGLGYQMVQRHLAILKKQGKVDNRVHGIWEAIS